MNKLLKIVPFIFLILWSSGAIFVEMGLKYSNPFSFLFLRYLFSSICLVAICIVIKVKLEISKKQILIIIISALFQQTGYQSFFFLALDNNLSPGILSIILGFQPIITGLLFYNNTTRYQWLGLFIGLSGLILIVASSIFNDHISNIGIIYGIFSLLFITFGTIFQKYITVPLPLNMSIQYVSSLMLYSLIIFFLGNYQVDWSINFILSLSWMVLIITVAATYLLYYMIIVGELTKVTSLFYFVPAVTSLFDYLFFRNTLGLNTILGLIFIFIGSYFINMKKGN